MDDEDINIEKYREECLNLLKDKDFQFKSKSEKEKNYICDMILSLIKDYRVENKIISMKLINFIISSESFENLKENYLNSFYKEVLKSFSFRDVELIDLALNYSLIHIQQLENGKEQLMDTIVYELNYNDKLKIIKQYVSKLQEFCKIYGTDLIMCMPKFIMTILQLLEIHEEYILKESLNILMTTMNLIWPILVKFYDMILGSMIYVYLENSEHEGKSVIHQQVRNILKVLENLTNIPVKQRIDSAKYEILKPLVE